MLGATLTKEVIGTTDGLAVTGVDESRCDGVTTVSRGRWSGDPKISMGTPVATAFVVSGHYGLPSTGTRVGTLPDHTPHARSALMLCCRPWKSRLISCTRSRASMVAKLPVKETVEGKAVWSCHIFDLHGNAKSSRALAWSTARG